MSTMESGPSPAAPTVFRPWLHRYTLLLAGLTLVLISAGGQVTSHGAGLSVPDWPTSYGYNMFTFPPSKWVGGIFYEHTHRLIASTVGLLTLGLAAWLWRSESRRWLRWLGIVAVLSVVAQGVLGGLTVIFLLPTPVSVAHACLAQSFFCLVCAIALFTSRGWIERSPRRAQRGPLDVRWFAIVSACVVFAQLVLGALVRHTDSALAIPDFPTAYGHWLPPLDEASVAGYNVSRRWELELPQVEAYQIAAQFAHRAGAAVALVVVSLFAVMVIRQREPRLSLPAAGLLILLAGQALLGAATVLTQRVPIIATLHVAVGAVILALNVVLALRCGRAFAPLGAEPAATAWRPQPSMVT